MKTKFLMIAVILTCISFSACSGSDTKNSNSSEANIIGADSNTNIAYPMDEQSFTSSQRHWVNLAKGFFIVDLEISEEISETQKANFFRYIISTPMYENKIKEWKTEDKYVIPLKDIEEIIFSHLNTQNFDSDQGFLNKGVSRYDSNLQEYDTSMIGGYGGAAALGVLEYCEDEDENTINIVLGSYEMNSFFNDPPVYILNGTYEVTFLITDNKQDFKVLKANSD